MTAELSVRAVCSAMSVRAHTRTSSENVADVLEALAALRPSADPAAREVELPEGDEACLFTSTSIVYTADQMRAALQSAASGREDSVRLDELQRWADENTRNGFKWATHSFEFESGETIRQQIDAAMSKGASHE